MARSSWTAADWNEKICEEHWLYTLNDEDISILSVAADRALEAAADSQSPFLPLNIIDEVILGGDVFLQSRFANHLREVVNSNVLHGPGFFIVKGLPTEIWLTRKSAMAFLLIGRLLGTLRPQNKQGHVLGHVADLKLSSDDPNVRVYQTCERQTFHTDSADIVMLLCLQPAVIGGVSSIVSTRAIYDRIAATRPDLLPSLLKPLATDRRGEVPPGALPFFSIPVFSLHDEGLLTGIYQRQYIDSAQRFPDAPRLTEKDVEALNLFDTLCNDPSMQFTLALGPGDLQILHNHTTLHDRSAFTDDADHPRHLLRAWIAPPSARPLPMSFAERFGSVEVGNRGGISLPDVEPVAIWDLKHLKETMPRS